MSGGWVAAIAAALGLATMLVTSLVGASAASADAGRVDYNGTISSLESYRDKVGTLVVELETLAAKTELTAAEQARADEIMTQLSGTSLSMKTALEGGGEGFETLVEKAAAARGEMEKTERALRALNAADALQNLRDAENAYADAISEAQERAAVTAQYDRIYSAYEEFMREHPGGLYTQGYSGPMGTMASKEENFFVYAQHKQDQPKPVWYSAEDQAAIQEERDFWAGIVAEMQQLGIDATSSVEEINNKMMEFDIAAGAYIRASGEKLSEAWQPIFDDLYTVMTDGTQFAQLPSFMRDAAIQYYDAYVGAVDQQAQLAEGDLMAMAADLTGYVQNMSDYVEDNADFNGLVKQFDELLQGPHTQESVDELNALLPLINEYIAAYNALTEDTSDDVALIPEFTLENLQAAQEEAEAAGEALAALDTTDIYKGLAMAKEEANGFASVLSRLGEGEGQLNNLHDAVMETARAMADELGVTDEAEIVKIGEELLEGLYDTYPGIADYVDTATGMLLEGWKEGIAGATNPWAELFEAAKLEDALKAAKRDMAALEDSSLWAELLAPEGKGLYQYAEDWARALIPDGTMEEVQAQAQAFVEAFFAMFADIDTGIMDADGRIAAGMEGIVATMRQAAHDAQAEASKLETAYRSLHADSIAREEVARGLQGMMEYARWGDTKNVSSIFEGLSTQAIDAIAAAMPELIDKLMEGTYAAEDFEAALAKLKEAETEAGKNAWQDYFHSTADGLREQSALWGEAMRGIIAEVAAADDRAGAFYKALMRLSDEGLDVSGLLAQYGALAVALLDGSASAEELYASLARLGELEALQIDLEQADALSGAAKSIDPANESYDPLAA